MNLKLTQFIFLICFYILLWMFHSPHYFKEKKRIVIVLREAPPLKLLFLAQF